jgi:fatty acid desaturase
MLFQYGVGVHDAEIDQIQAGNKSFKQMLPVMKKIFTKTRKQTVKDYVLFPLLAGPFAPIVFAGNVGANLMRNLWTFSIIFCGHFPEEVRTFTEAECENESRGHWYYRQLLGSANIEGGKLFHILSGNLSHQIEHHLFPDVPAHRYAEMAVEVRAICEKHGLPYHSGSFAKQFSSVWKRIFKLSLPDTVSDALFPPRMPAHAL